MTTTQTPAAVNAITSPKQQFLEGFERETATTLKVLKAYPEDQSELRPQQRMKTVVSSARCSPWRSIYGPTADEPWT